MTERRAFPPLHEDDLAADPFEQFARWYELAAAEVPLAEAMTVATVDADGAPDARMVLLKGHGSDGFRFHTNYDSAKAVEIAADPRGALILYWREHDRQVRARGPLAGEPARRLGLAAEPPARRPCRPRAPPRGGPRPLRRHRGRPPTRPLGRLSPAPADDRVLAGPAGPSPRSLPLHPCGRRLDDPAPRALRRSGGRARPCT
jgi:hypothetical protein